MSDVSPINRHELLTYMNLFRSAWDLVTESPFHYLVLTRFSRR
jgi:hypothetical protein